jgi:hypothetical protein
MYLVRKTLEDLACLEHDEAEIHGVYTTAAAAWSRKFIPTIAALLNDLAVKETPPNRKIMREKAAKSLAENAARQEKGVKPAGLSFAVADLVVLKRMANHRHKLAPPCKGPYKVVGVKSPGKYLLKGISPVLRDTSAAAEHLKRWSKDWYPELCETLINGDDWDSQEEEEGTVLITN